ncbi:hypothetical protein [Vibrio phage Va2]|nr:hypothetical protein [Vibrio phage Va2]
MNLALTLVALLVLSIFYILCWKSDSVKVKCLSILFAGAPFTIGLVLLLNFADESVSFELVSYFLSEMPSCDESVILTIHSMISGECTYTYTTFLIAYYYYVSITVFVLRLVFEILYDSITETRIENKVRDKLYEELEGEGITVYRD